MKSSIFHISAALFLSLVSVVQTRAASELKSPSQLKVPRFSIDYMDKTIEPGKDFYKYAAGNWVKNNPVPADKWLYCSQFEMADRNYEIVHRLLESALSQSLSEAESPLSQKTPSSSQNPIRNALDTVQNVPNPIRNAPNNQARQVVDFFASAMDTERLEMLKFKPIEQDLARIEQIKTIAEFFELLAEFHKKGIGGIFISDVQPDEKDTSVYAFHLNQGGLPLPDRDYYLKDNYSEQRIKYLAHVKSMFILSGESAEDASNHAGIVLELETELAKASRSAEDLRDPNKNYNKIGIAELIASSPSIPWKQYFAAREIPQISYVVVGQPEFFAEVDKLLRRRPLSDWKTYMRWHDLLNAAPFLHKAAELEDFNFFDKVLTGQLEQEPRWKRASEVLDAVMGEALGQLYVEKCFPADARVRMIDLVDNLCLVFRDHLQAIDWMSRATKRTALAKLESMRRKIGYPEKFCDYSSVEIRRDDYLGNVRRSIAFDIHRRTILVGRAVERAEWSSTPLTANAYFNETLNEIVLPAGILQPPFFDTRMDDAVNYGAIGFVIGHEITHGFDEQGRHYDAKGNLSDWWNETDFKEFEARSLKVVQEYDSFLLDEFDDFEYQPRLHVDGKGSVVENVADLGGVSIAYDALERVLKKDPSKRVNIDGFTPEQRFFISYAQIWRANVRDAAQKVPSNLDPHAPRQFRAVGPLLNFQEFYDAFGIKAGAPLWRTPEQRVQIW